jgi:DNA repair protein RecN (Recombination protein N)
VLRELHISGLGVIEDLDLELHPGLNVLTGETGAGKTMVTMGLSLVLGARAGAQVVRDGSASARVQARFDAPEGSEEWTDDGELLLARVVGSDGKSGARIGGQLATASALAQLGERLAEIHGQHQSLRLLETSTQTAFLDRFAGDGHQVAVAAAREAFAGLQEARAALQGLTEAARDRERELDLLAYQVNEIEAVGPRPGESEGLEAEDARLGHVERLLELAAAVESTLGVDTGGADALASADQGLAAVAELDPSAGDLAARARTLSAEATELVRDVRGYRESLATDPTRLQEVRERLATLRGLQRKYGATDADVLAFLAEQSSRLQALSGADERVAELQDEVDVREAEVGRLQAEVTEGRRAAAPRLSAALTEELHDLGMQGSVVEVALVALDVPGPAGGERVELRLAAGPGQPDRPLAKAASGGELSRVMLACRSVLADVDDVPTLIFDEVDAGIGGQAGLAVGRRLARLAQTRQVLVVTHLPQIACFADRHVRVRKDEGLASVEILDDEQRVQELSRMLAGLEASEHGVSHAEELLAEARRARAQVG